VRRLYDGVIATGRAETSTHSPRNYTSRLGWTPDAAPPSRALGDQPGAARWRALHTTLVAENDRLASISVWDCTITESVPPADFTSLDFFPSSTTDSIAEHWEQSDWVRVVQCLRAPLRRWSQDG